MESLYNPDMDDIRLVTSQYSEPVTLTLKTSPIILENYTPEIIGGFHQAVQVITDPDPKKGRLVILEGPQGTGKIYLVRAMCHASRGSFTCLPK